jgi:sec-independent protein translocase protein TatC
MSRLLNIPLAPVRFLFWLFALPVRAVKRAHRFMTEVPEDRSVLDAFTDAVQSGESFFTHIEVVRKHLLRMLFVLGVAVVVSFIFTEQVVAFLAVPVGGLEALTAIEVTESIGVFMRVALLTAVAVVSPYIAFEIWLFMAPGLMPSARRMGLVGIPLAVLFFLGGMAFAYAVMLPAALPFLLGFMDIQAELRPASYFRFVTGLMFWLGVSFEFPLVVYMLTSIGLIKPKALAQNARLAIVIIAILAALITPTVDPVNMTLVMIPLIVLYYFSIGLSYLAYAARRRKNLA